MENQPEQPMPEAPKPEDQGQQNNQPPVLPEAPENTNPQAPIDPDAKGPEQSGWEIDGGL